MSFLWQGVWNCPVWSVSCLWVKGEIGRGVHWGKSQPSLTPIHLTSPESLARMEAVVNLYQEMMKHAGEMLSTSPSSLQTP